MSEHNTIMLDNALFGIESLLVASMELDHTDEGEHETAIELLDMVLKRCRKLRNSIDEGVSHA
ncbi:hypothetical protein PRCB_11740 [Pantoea rodasii]|uniref:Uncharacterized protein n=1 Tax=Pantoea rodasii TaxID=1076549 RepID=A0A2M9WCU7_9GAMM|nr:hypothetical protein [Pantoea rodasii]ORM60114.1 hypothetical protein HA45_22110 [Pantoea rodasii]PJZ05354.1 hypothetical protein PRCB_11740 [Pantoea rodasii]